MAEINLLQSNQPTKKSDERWAKLLAVVSVILFAAAVIGAGFVFFLNRSVTSQQEKLQQQVADKQVEITSAHGYDELIASQNKLKNVKWLLDHHLDWSQLLPKFYDATLSSATYSKFVAQKDGTAIITGNVGSFVDLDKLIQAYQLADFKSYIKDIKLVNIGFSNDLNKPGVSFTISVSFNNDIIKAKAEVLTPVLVNPPGSKVQTQPSLPIQGQ